MHLPREGLYVGGALAAVTTMYTMYRSRPAEALLLDPADNDDHEPVNEGLDGGLAPADNDDQEPANEELDGGLVPANALAQPMRRPVQRWSLPAEWLLAPQRANALAQPMRPPMQHRRLPAEWLLAPQRGLFGHEAIVQAPAQSSSNNEAAARSDQGQAAARPNTAMQPAVSSSLRGYIRALLTGAVASAVGAAAMSSAAVVPLVL